jgi:hypothetical protein
MKYFRLEDKINETKQFAKHGLKDVKQTGIASLNGYVGLKKGYPLFIAGSPGSGKTEFTLEILMNASITHKWKHFIYCGEGGNVEHIFNELLHKYLQKPYDWANEKDKMQAEYFVSQHFIIANHDNDFTIDEFYASVSQCEKELEIKFDTTVFDPFNDIKDETELFGGREDKYLAHALKQCRISSKKNNRIDILVNHTADVKAVIDPDSKKRYTPFALPNEWAGGRTWQRRGFTMIMLWRPPTFLKDDQGMPYAENETHVIIQKAKPKGVAKIGTRSIFYDWQKNRYYSYEGSQQLYSCETLESIAPKRLSESTIKPNTDFTQPINDKLFADKTDPF